MVSISGIGRIAKSAGKLIFMDPKFTETAEKALKASKKAQGWKNIHKQIGDAFVSAEKATAKDPFWKDLWHKQILGTPKDLKNAWINSKGIWGTTKAIGKQVLHRLPIIFTLFELPNIFSAFKDEGIIGGCTEILKSGTRLATSMAGFLIGQALIPIPILGGLIGAFATDWLTSKVIGKSHSEKKAELEEAQKQGDALQYQNQMELMKQQNPNAQQNFTASNINTPKMTVTPQQLMMMQNALYGGGMTNTMDQDFMAMSSGINNLGKNLNLSA